MTEMTDAQAKLLATADEDGVITVPPLAHRTAAALVRSGLATADADDPRRLRVVKAQAEPPAPEDAPDLPATKTQLLLDLLKRPRGATLAELQAATGWQAHSVRGALSGTVRKKLKMLLISERTEAGRTYRVEVVARP